MDLDTTIIIVMWPELSISGTILLLGTVEYRYFNKKAIWENLKLNNNCYWNVWNVLHVGFNDGLEFSHRGL